MLLLWAGIIFCKGLSAQQNDGSDSLKLKPRVYSITIKLNKKEFRTGYLANLTDSALQLSSSPVYFHLGTKNQFNTAYNYDKIERVSIQRKGAIGRGAIQGALIGLSLGVITGLASGNDSPDGILYFSAAAKAIGLGIMGILAGAIVGLVLGAFVHKRFAIDGNKKSTKKCAKVFSIIYCSIPHQIIFIREIMNSAFEIFSFQIKSSGTAVFG